MQKYENLVFVTASAEARKIREAQERKGLYHADVTKMVGVSRSCYTFIEAGKREIYFTFAVNLCRALDLNIDNFVKYLK